MKGEVIGDKRGDVKYSYVFTQHFTAVFVLKLLSRHILTTITLIANLTVSKRYRFHFNEQGV